MKRSTVLFCLGGLVGVVATAMVSPAHAETVQTAAHVFDGRPYLWVEAESFSSLVDGGTAGNGWKVVTKGGPDMSTIVTEGGVSLPVLPTDSNVSGTAIWSQANQGSAHEDMAQYELKFITPGTYQFFLRHSLYDSGTTPATFLNEDSLFLPPAFNKNSHSDWVGAEVLDFNDADLTVDIPNPGEALDPDGYQPTIADHMNDGLLELVFGRWKSAEDAGGSSADITPGSGHSDAGHFDWYNRPTFTGATATGGFDGFYGTKVEYTVTPEMVGQTVTFEIGVREVNVTIDGFMFIQTENIYPNMDLLDLYTQEEVDAAILPQPVAGDYDNNGTVDAADFVVWRNGDSPDDTQAGYDLWRANFGRPGAGLGTSVSAVPEPASFGLLAISLAALYAARRRSGC
jgi:hypothetical protein